MTAQAEKIVEKDEGEKTPGKLAEKPHEKRRALGRGLESLLPSKPSTQYPVPSSQQDRDASPQLGVEQATSSGAVGESPAINGPIPIRVSEVHAEAEGVRPAADGVSVVEIPIHEIDHNPYQTRSAFDQAFLDDLADSIRSQGVIQPIVVRPATPPLKKRERTGEELRYILILGERRLRASTIAGKTAIPAVVKRVSEQQAAEMTLVENLQRQDLNCMDQAKAFRNLSDNFGLTQEEIGKRVGVSREAVSNYMRLLRLPEGVQMFLKEGQLTYSHARLLLMIEDADTLERMADKAVKEKMSVLKLEEVIGEMQFKARGDDNSKRRGARWVDPNVRAATRDLERILGMKVWIRDRKGKGAIRIEYTSLEEYDRLVGLLTKGRS